MYFGKDRRFYERINVAVNCNIYTDTNEITGKIKDISEDGFQIVVNKEVKVVKNQLIGFEFVDKYKYLNEERTDIIIGNAKVVWIDFRNGKTRIGCSVSNDLEIIDYVGRKKVNEYIDLVGSSNGN